MILMDFESSDQDLLEDEPELEDGESADDTKDSVNKDFRVE